MKLDYKFTHVEPFVSNRTSFGYDTDAAHDVKLRTQIVIDPELRYGGWYEIYDIDSSGVRFHVSGVLEIFWDTEDNRGDIRLIGYDGCFELPDYIIKALERKGVIIDL